MDNGQRTLNSELGEVKCPKCDGTGSIDAGVYIAKTCDKCQGTGKLDWCQQAVGVAPKPYFHFDSSAAMSLKDFAEHVWVESTPRGHSHFQQIYMDSIDKASEKLSEKIDNEILGTLEQNLEQIHEEKIQENEDII